MHFFISVHINLVEPHLLDGTQPLTDNPHLLLDPLHPLLHPSHSLSPVAAASVTAVIGSPQALRPMGGLVAPSPVCLGVDRESLCHRGRLLLLLDLLGLLGLLLGEGLGLVMLLLDLLLVLAMLMVDNDSLVGDVALDRPGCWSLLEGCVILELCLIMKRGMRVSHGQIDKS